MSYQTLIEDKKSSEHVSLFLALRTKNIFAVDNLAEKGYIPAILKRIEFAALKNDQKKIDELKSKISLLVDNNEDRILIEKDIFEILDKNLPNIAKKPVLKI